jgi:uncharacterized RDD family membrane protein YckC
VSTLGQPVTPVWRQEVNRRLAEHKNRKAGAPPESAPAEPAISENMGTSRAAQAAARVAARYAKAPSYSQIQAEEARIAVRAAEIATKVAIEAQSVAETAMAGLHAATVEEPMRAAGPAEIVMMPTAAQAVAEPELPAAAPDWAAEQATAVAAPEMRATEAVLAEPQFAESKFAESRFAEFTMRATAVEEAVPVAESQVTEPMVRPEPVAEPVAGPVTDCRDSAGQVVQIRWEPDMPLRSSAAEAQADPFELTAEDWWTPAEQAPRRDEPAEIEAHTIPANLIEFPRELVATRRMRPRLLDGPAAAQPGTQLSIFEVDPGSIQTEAPAPEMAVLAAQAWAETETHPAAESVVAAASAAEASAAGSVTWATAEWPGMKLDAQAARMPAQDEERSRPALAPLSRRLMAGVVDCTLVVAAATFLWLTLALGAQQALAMRSAELLGAGALAAAGLAYHAFFCLLSLRTPGMRYAGLVLSTFEDAMPTREQMRRRLGAMALSMLPLGLGMVWSVFDEDHLSWHDRYSQTYLRMS